MIRSSLAGLALALLALSSLWLLIRVEEEAPEPKSAERRQPDYYMEGFVTVKMDDKGRPHREFRADRLEHFPDTDTHEVKRPHIILHKTGEKPWNVTSESGWMSADGNVVLLHGRVRIWQDDEKDDVRLEVITSDVRVRLDSNYAETDQPALIQGPWGETDGVGMQAYLEEKRVRLLSDVHTRYLAGKTD
jgi:lipopolysaccharide export system protein LptC